jgi:hypothetical protein
MPDLTFDEALFETSRKLDAAEIPLVIEADESDIDALLRMFPESEDWYLSAEAARAAIAQRRMFNAIHFMSGIKLDLILLKAGEFEKLKFSRRRRVERAGQGFWISSPEDLLLSKAAWGMPSDSAVQKRDIHVLMRDWPELDWNYVNHWADKLGVRGWIENART